MQPTYFQHKGYLIIQDIEMEDDNIQNLWFYCEPENWEVDSKGKIRYSREKLFPLSPYSGDESCVAALMDLGAHKTLRHERPRYDRKSAEAAWSELWPDMEMPEPEVIPQNALT